MYCPNCHAKRYKILILCTYCRSKIRVRTNAQVRCGDIKGVVEGFTSACFWRRGASGSVCGGSRPPPAPNWSTTPQTPATAGSPAGSPTGSPLPACKVYYHQPVPSKGCNMNMLKTNSFIMPYKNLLRQILNCLCIQSNFMGKNFYSMSFCIMIKFFHQSPTA